MARQEDEKREIIEGTSRNKSKSKSKEGPYETVILE
jgi:hypothetical protein